LQNGDKKEMENMTDDNPLPLARMVSIKEPSFWIFIGACMLLYIYNKAITPDAGDVVKYISTGNYIIAAAFAALFLNVISGGVKSTKTKYIFGIACYVFEIAAVLSLLIMVIIKR
jgi:hypothetical protein